MKLLIPIVCVMAVLGSFASAIGQSAPAAYVVPTSEMFSLKLCDENKSFRQCFDHSEKTCLQRAAHVFQSCTSLNPIFLLPGAALKKLGQLDVEVSKSLLGCMHESYAYMSWKDFSFNQLCVDLIQRQRVQAFEMPIRWKPLGTSRWLQLKIQRADDEALDEFGAGAIVIACLCLGAFGGWYFSRKFAGKS